VPLRLGLEAHGERGSAPGPGPDRNPGAGNREVHPVTKMNPAVTAPADFRDFERARDSDLAETARVGPLPVGPGRSIASPGPGDLGPL
jgi:hypothetical protein